MGPWRALYRALFSLCGPYIGTSLKLYGPCRGPVELTQHLQNLPNTFIIYPTTSEFTQQLQNLTKNFRNYPPLQNLPTPSEFTHPIPCPLSIFFRHHEGPHKRCKCLNPCMFRLRSTPSSLFLVNKTGFGGSGPF